MSNILDRAKAHFDSSRFSLDVPEWGEAGKPLVVTWSPLTVAERRRVYEPIDNQPPDGGIVMVRVVIRKACDASGRKLFDGMAEHDLMHGVDSDIIGRLSNAILYGVGRLAPTGIQEEIDAEKNV